MNKLYIDEIMKYLPHRYPFLLVDRVTEYDLNASITGYKNLSVNEDFFNGHFPGKAVMPGVLMIEAMAQLSGILILKSLDVTSPEDNMFFLAGVDKTRFKKIVVPGDRLDMNVEVLKIRRDLWKFKGTCSVDGELACSAEFMNIKAGEDV